MRKTYKLTEAQREEIVRIYNETDASYSELAVKYGVSKQNIAQLVNAKKRKPIPTS